MRFEPAGLRIALPLGNQPEKRGTGVGTRLIVQGDFEITMGFEILHEPKPTEAGPTQTRVSVEALLDRPTGSRNMASLSRRVTEDGTRFFAWQVQREETNSQEKPTTRLLPAKAKTGRLRLQRSGNLLSYCVAEGSAEQYTLLLQCPFGTENLKEVRLVGSTGSPQASLDVRITDVRIRAQSFPNPAEMQAVTLAQAGEQKDEEKSTKGQWGWVLELLGLVIAFAWMAFLGMWLFLRHKQRAPVENKPAKTEAASVVSFICSACGRNLKAKRELAGKKVKCFQCGRATLVPETPVSGPAFSKASKGWSRKVFMAVLVVSGLLAGSTFLLVYGAYRLAHDSNQAQSSLSTQYFDQLLGWQETPGIAEEGFHDPELSPTGTPFRWTNGAAKLVVPLGGVSPKALYIHLWQPVKCPRLRIQVNGQLKFETRASVKDWSRTFDLSDLHLGSALTLEILSDTVVPAEQNRASDDARVLGVQLFGFTLVSGTKNYADVPLGVREVPEVVESGFYDPEGTEDQPNRWTDGAAQLTVPLRGKVPRTLALTLEIPNLPEYRLQVTVNGRKLFDDVVSEPQWQMRRSIEIPLSGVDLGDSARIELDSSTFVPSQTGANPKDNRKLGVRVKRLILATETAPSGPK